VEKFFHHRIARREKITKINREGREDPPGKTTAVIFKLSFVQTLRKRGTLKRAGGG